jgi:hypothetical protein
MHFNDFYQINLYVFKNQQILELFNMKLSNTIDQTLICKKSYDDHLGYFWTGHQKTHWSPKESKIDLRLG